ncbi:MAG: C1 family peptidase [Myxococcota bacterium]
MPGNTMLDENRPAVERDSTDFRDEIYRPALRTLPTTLLPDVGCITLRNQRKEGSCTGFGLAAMINYLNQKRGITEPVSARMLYEMAKRYDRWPGTTEEGSSARGAMKGWHKHGVCSETAWEDRAGKKAYLSKKRQEDALRFPLGAYYRVLPRRSDLHAALTETGAVFASAGVHAGWEAVTKGGVIRYPRRGVDGGHAFCILGYTEEGFLIQNSWGEAWGGITVNRVRYPGMALWRYEDFDVNLWDAWVARLALPVDTLQGLSGISIEHNAQGVERVEKGPAQHVISGHYVHVDDGVFRTTGNYPSDLGSATEMLDDAISETSGTSPGQILLYAHGGLNSVKGAAKRVAAWRPVFEKNGVWEIHFIWETGFVETLTDVLFGKRELVSRRVGGDGEWVDRIIERATQRPGHALWKEIQDDARRAFLARGAGTAFIKALREKLVRVPRSKRPTLHLAGHSAGAVWLGHLLDRWEGIGAPPISTLQLLAPACTVEFFHKQLEPHVEGKRLRTLVHYLLDEETERADDVAMIYRKSLLYLVSRAYQDKSEVVPIMGLEEHWSEVDPVAGVTSFVTGADPDKTQSKTHGDFDNDPTTMNQVLRTVIGRRPTLPFESADLPD